MRIFKKNVFYLFLFCFFLSSPLQAATFLVNSEIDTNDATPGDTICADGSAPAVCSLRAAIQEANALAGEDTVTLPAGNYTLNLGTALLVSESLTLNGTSPATTIIDGNEVTQLFSVSGGGTDFTLSRVTVTGGNAAQGSFLRYQGDELSLDEVHVTQNVGGEIIHIFTGSFSFSSTVFSANNYANTVLTNNVGGILTNCIFFNNSSTSAPGVISSGDNLTINNSLITGNTSVGGGAVDSGFGTITFQNTILSNNQGGNCSASAGSLASGGNNIEDLNECGFASAGDYFSTNPLLGTLDTTSYILPFYPLSSDSVAKDGGNNATCATLDIRGVVRGSQGAACDIGPYEGNVATATALPTSLVFSDTLLGSSSTVQTFTLTNSGEYTLVISDIDVPAEFSQTNDCSGTISVGGTCTVSVTFSPTTVGDHSANLTITHNGSGSSTAIALSGTGRSPALASSVDSLTFADQEINTESSSQSVELTNNGDVDLTLSAIAISDDFSQTSDCEETLGAGESCRVSVTFFPTAVGEYAGTLTITHSGIEASTVISLTGSAVLAVQTQYQGDSVVNCSLSVQNKSSDKVQMFLWLVTLGFLLFRRIGIKRKILPLFLFFVFVFSQPLSLHALDASLSNEIFKPTVDDSDYFTVYSSPVLKKNQYHFGLLFDYFHNPIQLGDSSSFDSVSPINSDVILGHAFGSYSPLQRLSVGASLPFYLQNTVRSGVSDVTNMDLGDVEVNVKYNLLDRKKSKVGLSVLGYGIIPTATRNTEHFTGNGSFGGGAKLIVDSQVHRRVNVAINTGAEIKESFTNVDGNKYGSTLNLDAAVAYDLIPKRLKLIAENQIETQFSSLFERVSSPMEARLGLRYRFKKGINVNLGGGLGYRSALASPEFRVFAGATYSSNRSDEFKLPEALADEFMLDEKEWAELQLGEELKLKDKIFFDYNQADLRPISKPTLNKLALFLKKHEEFKKLRVEGHTCDIGSKSYNLKLSQKRADEVKNYLIDQGVDNSRLSSVGKGMENPLVPNSDDFHREQNRRVSIFVEEKQ